MKKINKIFRIGAIVALSTALPGLWACNSRPTYWTELSELTSDCDGGVQLRIHTDPDPETPGADIAAESRHLTDVEKVKSVDHDGNSLTVIFRSGVTCEFFTSDEEGRCRHAVDDARKADCSAKLKLIELQKPTRPGGGWMGDDPNAVRQPAT